MKCVCFGVVLELPVNNFILIVLWCSDDQISEAMEKPVCLISTDSEGQMFVVKEAKEILDGITQPVTVVSVVGLYRTGKSYLMNRLAGQQTGKNQQNLKWDIQKAHIGVMLKFTNLVGIAWEYSVACLRGGLIVK